jgi:hypothetical protein
MGQQAAIDAGIVVGVITGIAVRILVSDPENINSTIPITTDTSTVQLTATAHPVLVQNPISVPPGYAALPETSTPVETNGSTFSQNYSIYKIVPR